jgi:hypothetical protein
VERSGASGDRREADVILNAKAVWGCNDDHLGIVCVEALSELKHRVARLEPTVGIVAEIRDDRKSMWRDTGVHERHGRFSF